MSAIPVLVRYLRMIRSLLRPAYHPERYYMRGPGPACLRRTRGGLRTDG